MCSALSQTALGRRGRSSVKLTDRVGAIDAFEGEDVRSSSSRRQLLAVVLGRPAEQAQEIDEGLGQEAGVAVGGDADDGTVLALGELGAVGRHEQRQVRERGRRRRPAASKISTCLKVLVRWSWPRMMWVMRRSASSAQEARW